jgi:hypothetical protein
MAYYTGSGGALPPRFAAGVKLRVDNGGTYLGAINPVLNLINQRYGTSIGVPTPTTAPAPIPVKSFLTPLISPTPVPTPVPSSFSPTPAPTPVPVYAPPPPPPAYTPAPPIPGNDPFAAPPSQDTGAGAVAAAAAPIIGAIDPAAGAAAALIPAFTNAAGGGPTSQIRFDSSDAGGGAFMPDVTGPEVYNADGTPVTNAAKTATIIDKFKALPPAAKIGGAVALLALLSRR